MPAIQNASGKAGNRRWLFIVKQTGVDWVADNAMRLSAALAMYAILSLAPLLVIIVKIVSVIWRDKEVARAQVMRQLSTLMGAQAAKGIQPLLSGTARHGNGSLATLLSIAVLLFSSTGVFAELQNAMNTIWHVKPKIGHGVWEFFRHRLLSLAMVFGIMFLLLVSMFVSVLLSWIASYFAGDARALLLVVDIAMSFTVTTLLFGATFKFLPDIEVQWSDVWRAALLTAVLFALGKYGLALYFRFGSPTSAFGAAGSFVAVLLWVYYSSFILFLGAEFSKVWAGQGDENANVQATK